MEQRLASLLAAIAVFLMPAGAFADTIVVPNFYTNNVGNAAGDGPGIPVDYRIQILAGNGQFPGPMLITGVGIRAIPGTGPASISFDNLSLYLSTSSRFPNSNAGPLLSTTFADNIGPDNTLVLSGSVSANTPGCSGPGVCPFFDIFRFTTPFYYIPSQGRLLMDIQGSFSSTGQFDSVEFGAPGGPLAGLDGPLNSPVGQINYGQTILQFTFTPVPEPATGVIVGLGLAAFWRCRRRVRRALLT